MDGQWLGRVTGDVPGLGVLELDDDGQFLDGIAYHFPDDPLVPSSSARIRIPRGQLNNELFNLKLTPVHPEMGVWMTPQDLLTHFPDYTVSETVDLGIKFVGETVDFAYATEITKGAGWLLKSKAHEPSVLPVKILTWDQFRDRAVKVDARTHVFRGQCSQHRLRTSFHRTRRKNLAKYRDGDIDQVRRILSPILKHVFDRRDPFQTGGLYSLIQHHGYPTPLLDWSYSPFVAAYFAFRSKPGARPGTDYVRVFEFDRMQWHTDYAAYSSIAYAKPHVSFADFLGIENPRMVPQQATALITNVDDIEGYVMGLEQLSGRSYLTAIDIPLSERDLALSELDLMGINAGSMFPGIDGACEGLTYKNFGV